MERQAKPPRSCPGSSLGSGVVPLPNRPLSPVGTQLTARRAAGAAARSTSAPPRCPGRLARHLLRPTLRLRGPLLSGARRRCALGLPVSSSAARNFLRCPGGGGGGGREPPSAGVAAGRAQQPLASQRTAPSGSGQRILLSGSPSALGRAEKGGRGPFLASAGCQGGRSAVAWGHREPGFSAGWRG